MINAADLAQALVKLTKETGAGSMTMVFRDLNARKLDAVVVVAVREEIAELLNEFSEMISEPRGSK